MVLGMDVRGIASKREKALAANLKAENRPLEIRGENRHFGAAPPVDNLQGTAYIC
jgi:hypothetical protein